MKIGSFGRAILAGVAVPLLLMGCGSKDPNALAQKNAELFRSAPEEVKAGWDLAVQAMKTNGYAIAILALGTAQSQPGLSDAQVKALSQTATAINDKMYDAVNKGDAQGLQALEELRAARAR